jgi:hypothetical protein
MSYRIAGIDVHKKVLAVVIAEVEVEGEYQFARRLFSSSPDNLRLLAERLIQQEVEEAVMESTAQYNIANRCGEHWSGTGSRFARSGKALARRRERYMWRRHSPIVDDGAGRRISRTPNDW